MKARDLRLESEKKYLSRARQGDVKAFEALVLSHDAFVSSVCLSILKNVHLAEDASQETFIKAWRGIKNFKAQSSFSTWLFTIAKNTCRDILEKEKPVEELSDTLVSGESVEDEAVARSECDEVRRALLCLDRDAREVLVLREWRGLSYLEIAEVLGISEGTVKSRIARAREKLLEILKEKL